MPAEGQTAPPPVYAGENGTLVYTRDSLGNRVPDFSFCGFGAGNIPIPDVSIKIVVPVAKGDATSRIQAALDYVASLPTDEKGFRGAVLLEKGQYSVLGSLRMNASGVVLRGSGMGPDGTQLIGAGLSREAVIMIAGQNDRKLKGSLDIREKYVPVNATSFQVAPGHELETGDNVLVHRPSTQEWIDTLKTQDFGGNLGYFGWKPGEQDIFWDRKITAVDGNIIKLDAPITTAIDDHFGGGKIIPYQWEGRIMNVGVENLRLISTYDESNPKDENHRWMAITLNNVKDAWVRQVVFEHFAGSAVAVYETAKRVTVEDCKSLQPVSEIGGHRRYTFYTQGQQTLFQRLYAEYGYHDFAVGHAAAGPNAFVQCHAYLPYNFSGAIDSWASGVLFDIVSIDGNSLSFDNRRLEAQGAGWTAANSMFWQCSAARIYCPKPPTAQNWAFGAWAQLIGDGYWYEENSHIKPYSLYYAQLRDRLGQDAVERAQLLTIETNPTSSPTIEQAASLSALSDKPAPLLSDYIDQASLRQPIPIDGAGVQSIDKVRSLDPVSRSNSNRPHFDFQNGWLVNDSRVLTGFRHQVRWWRGGIRPQDIQKADPHITRFVPGVTGTGGTDILSEVVEWMESSNIVAIDHNYGLWYDRRRDDHERVRRMTGDVWAPFYELPYARSGKGTAWDGLSKYDLNEFNPWYWSRLKEYADLAAEKGLVLLHQNYFQHNILEAGAHWADFPWRSANNINNTGFPEPPPYAGDKRIFMAEEFYDISHPGRRQLHRQYIRKCMDNFSDNDNVIQFISAEYTGPLHFMQFWIDTIIEWEKETGEEATIALSATKDVQDAILSDRKRARAVDIIDIRYWHYREDGSLYAPKGGQHLAPRQHARLVSSGKKTFAQTYRAVREYRIKYPDKAVMYSAGGDELLGWASFMAGGSLATIPAIEAQGFAAAAAQMSPLDLPREDLATAAAEMSPVDLSGDAPGQYVLGSSEGFIIYTESYPSLKLPRHATNSKFAAQWFDASNGKLLGKTAMITGDKINNLKIPQDGPVVLWLSKK